jgi:uncharacterized protein (TIGR02117 family)
MKHACKQLKRLALYAAGSGLTIAALLTIAAVTPRKWGTLPPSEDCRFTVYISGDWMHTNLIVPTQTPVFDWNERLNLSQSRAPQPYAYLQMGWGDRIFYIETPAWDQISITSALRSLLLQNPAAMFVRGHPTLPQIPHETMKCVRLGQTDFRALMNFLDGSFEQDAQGNLISLKGTEFGQGKFFAATGKYSMFRTCNSWTADGLRAAYVNTPVWGGLASAVMHQIRNGCPCELPQ